MPISTPTAPFAPSSALVALGLAKEATFGTFVNTPTVWMVPDEATFTPTNELLERPGSRQRIGRTSSVAGMFTGKATLSCEADPDNVEALLCFALGLDALADSGFGTTAYPNFQAPISNPANNGTVSTTLASTVQAGSEVANLTAIAGVANIGLLTVGSGGNAETVQTWGKHAGSGATGVVAARFARSHASSSVVVSSTVVPAHLRAIQMQSPRPTFTTRVYRVTDDLSYAGCKVSSLTIAPAEKAVLSVKVQLEYQNEASNGGYSTYDPTPTWPTPPSPTLSTLEPFTFQSSFNYGLIDGVASSATIMGWQVAMENGLVADYPNFGGGRLRAPYPEQQTKVSGSLDLGFETEDLIRKFWGNDLAGGPQSVVLSTVLNFQFETPWLINASYQYTMSIVLPKIKLSTVGVPIKGGDYLKQSAKFEAYESADGAQDDLTVFLINANGSSSNTGGF